MKLRSTAILLATLMASCAGFAADCSRGAGSGLHALWDGYVQQIGPSPSQARACRTALLAPDGSTLFELTGANASFVTATGNDITNEGKRDVVLETDSGPEQCCYVYAIVVPGETPALRRRFWTSVELNFGDREGDGKIEIWAHDFAFRNFDHLMREQSPAPLVIFRLRAGTLYNVSSAFWTDYESDINQAKSLMGRKDLEDFTGNPTPQLSDPNDPAKSPDDKDKKDLDPDELRRRNDTEGLVLQVILDYLYGGRGAEGWSYLSDVWPQLDKQRVRQDILKARMSGILAEINRTTPPAGAPQ